MKFYILILIFGILLVNFVIAKDVSVFQGQYFIDDKFQVGTYEFEFNVYDDETSGDLIYSDKENITLGNWGQWKVELAGLSEAANNVSKDYFMEVIIDGISQLPRKRITQFNFLRKDVDEITQGRISAGSFIISNNDKIDQGFFVDAEKNYSTTINAKLNVTDDAFFKNLSVNDKNVCLEDGTNCQIINDSDLDVNSSVFWNGLSSFLSGWLINNQGILEFNDVKLNSTIDERASNFGDNLSWNENYANTKYVLESNERNLDVNSSVFWNGLNSFLSGWLINNQGILEFNDVKLNSTIDERASNFGDNNSWNENYANTKYVLESNERNLDVNSSVFWNGLSNVRGILGSLIINDMGWIDNTVNNLVNYYTKNEIDLKLSQKLDASNSISNTVNNLVNYYTKNEIDLKLSQKQNASSSIASSSINENKIPVSFISTTSGDLKKNVVYLPLGTSGQISTQASDSSWIIDKDLVITGILWNSNINSRINPSRIILMKSVTSKNFFSDTNLNVNLQGFSKGSSLNFNASFNQGDLAVIKYEPTGGANERINDLSITLVGYYD